MFDSDSRKRKLCFEKSRYEKIRVVDGRNARPHHDKYNNADYRSYSVHMGTHSNYYQEDFVGQWLPSTSVRINTSGHATITTRLNSGTIIVNGIHIPTTGGSCTCTTTGDGNVVVYTNGTRQVYGPATGSGYNATNGNGYNDSNGSVKKGNATCQLPVSTPQKCTKTETGPDKAESYDESELPVLLDGDECTICYDQYRKIEDMAFLPCAHYFHEKCLNDWLSIDNTCPICRMNAF